MKVCFVSLRSLAAWGRLSTLIVSGLPSTLGMVGSQLLIVRNLSTDDWQSRPQQLTPWMVAHHSNSTRECDADPWYSEMWRHPPPTEARSHSLLLHHPHAIMRR